MTVKFKVTSHKNPPPPLRTGITEALRALQINQSIYIPFDPETEPSKQRKRLDSLVQTLRTREGLKYTIRKAEKGGFDIYRVE